MLGCSHAMAYMTSDRPFVFCATSLASRIVLQKLGLAVTAPLHVPKARTIFVDINKEG